jgi:hypothetical protein
MSRIRLFGLIVGLAACMPAPACQCTFGLLSQDAMERAEQVFVFQLVAAEHIDSGERPSAEVAATIRVVDILLGAEPPTRMRYSTLWCCGSSLHLGHYYAAILPSAGVGDFFGTAGNLLPLGEFFEAQQVERLRRVIDGHATLEACFGELPSTRINIIPPPPPPPPTSGDAQTLPLPAELDAC